METIKKLEAKLPNRHTGYTAKDIGYYKALKDVIKLIDEVDFGVSTLMINRKGQGDKWVNVKELKARIKGK